MKKNKACKLTATSLLPLLFLMGCNAHSFFDREEFPSRITKSSEDISYTIRYGDTLSSIARRYDASVKALAVANNLVAPYAILAGDVLRIPGTTPAGTVHHPDQEPWPDHDVHQKKEVARADDQPPLNLEDSARYHLVGSGESLSDIAYQYDLGIGELAVANAIKAIDEIEVGQRLIIPPSEDMLNRRAQKLVARRQQETTEVIAAPPLSSRGFLWPVDGTVIQTFRQSYAAGESGAISIAASIGTAVRATNHGIVVFAGEILDRYGHMIVLRHADDYTSLYAHNDELHVKEGDFVSRGQIIATVGNSGIVDSGQLRFELRKRLEPIDPEQLLGQRPDLHKTLSMSLIKS